MARGWVLEDSQIDPLELSDELKDFARAMVGESAVSLTSDRAHILDTAALTVELYCARMYFRGVGGAPRVATSVVDVEAPFDRADRWGHAEVDRRHDHLSREVV